jgi:16S rRNA (uracil1498-N3)-methyltransferase
MHLFYTPDVSGNYYTLNETESKHSVRVLRLQNGDVVYLTDGVGGFYKAVITDNYPKACVLEITESHKEYEKRPYKIHMAVAPTKNMDRLEWFIEKATEIGIDEFTPIICEHSERKALNNERLEKVVVSAMKQSIKAYKPIINEAVKFDKFIKSSMADIKLIAHCEELPIRRKISDIYNKGNSVICLIGPEGDFSKNEIENAYSAGFQGITLGKSRLRVETAALVACHSIYFMNM